MLGQLVLASQNLVKTPLAQNSIMSLTAQLGVDPAHAMMSAMQLVDVPAAMVDGQGRLQKINHLFIELAGKKIYDGADRLVFDDPKLAEIYKTTVRDLSNGGSGIAIGIQNPSSRPIIVHVIPVRGSLKDIFPTSAAILVLAGRHNKATLPTILLESLFDLSPAEARVVRMLCEGFTPTEIAQRCELSASTVRSHLKSAFSKTHTHRQSELVSLLASYNNPRIEGYRR